MAIMGFIFGCAAAVFSVLGWGVAGTAFSRTNQLKEVIAGLEARLAKLEGGDAGS